MERLKAWWKREGTEASLRQNLWFRGGASGPDSTPSSALARRSGDGGRDSGTRHACAARRPRRERHRLRLGAAGARTRVAWLPQASRGRVAAMLEQGLRFALE